jgi:uncharacterized lipoprotein YmbA
MPQKIQKWHSWKWASPASTQQEKMFLATELQRFSSNPATNIIIENCWITGRYKLLL